MKFATSSLNSKSVQSRTGSLKGVLDENLINPIAYGILYFAQPYQFVRYVKGNYCHKTIKNANFQVIKCSIFGDTTSKISLLQREIMLS